MISAQRVSLLAGAVVAAVVLALVVLVGRAGSPRQVRTTHYDAVEQTRAPGLLSGRPATHSDRDTEQAHASQPRASVLAVDVVDAARQLPIQGAAVAVLQRTKALPAVADWTRLARTDSAGHTVVKFPPSDGGLALSVSHPEYQPQTVLLDSERQVRVSLRRGYVVRGNVTAVDARPVPEATVTIWKPGARAEVAGAAGELLVDEVHVVRAGLDGSWALTLEPGPWRARALAPGFCKPPLQLRTSPDRTDTASFDVGVAGGEESVSLELAYCSLIRLQLRDKATREGVRSPVTSVNLLRRGQESGVVVGDLVAESVLVGDTLLRTGAVRDSEGVDQFTWLIAFPSPSARVRIGRLLVSTLGYRPAAIEVAIHPPDASWEAADVAYLEPLYADRISFSVDLAGSSRPDAQALGLSCTTDKGIVVVRAQRAGGRIWRFDGVPVAAEAVVFHDGLGPSEPFPVASLRDGALIDRVSWPILTGVSTAYRDAAGRPISGVRESFTFEEEGSDGRIRERTLMGVARRSGEPTFNGLPPGRYRLSAGAGKGLGWSREFEVEEGRVLQLELAP